jgi:hypothetical protein
VILLTSQTSNKLTYINKESLEDIERLHQEDPDSLRDPQEVSPASEDDIIDEWLDEGCDDVPRLTDITEIIKSCLKGVKKIYTPRAFKAFIQLNAVLQFVKLRERYQKHNRCKEPGLNASLAIARQLGKNQYCARQIRENERYLVQHGRLPPSKRELLHGQFTLLDNPAIVQNIRTYLAAQTLGEITPLELCCHVNSTICPALGLSGTNASISERTARNWLHKLGYSFVETRKGLYFDGHERPDVLEARVKFLEIMQGFERYDRYFILTSTCETEMMAGSCILMMTRQWSLYHLTWTQARSSTFLSHRTNVIFM